MQKRYRLYYFSDCSLTNDFQSLKPNNNDNNNPHRAHRTERLFVVLEVVDKHVRHQYLTVDVEHADPRLCHTFPATIRRHNIRTKTPSHHFSTFVFERSQSDDIAWLTRHLPYQFIHTHLTHIHAFVRI
jgi:hypothetical protein